MESRILNLLKERQGEFITDQYISSALAISESQVSKELLRLKEAGYEIQFIPHRGIKLIEAPDRITPYDIKQNLKTEILAKQIYCFDQLPSTNSKAKELARKTKAEGLVVIAGRQSEGRGRRERQWVSPEGGLYLSVVLKPRTEDEETSKFYLLSSIAVCQALRKISGINCLIKWPNDIITDHKKLAGILAEGSISKGKLEFLILGIGVNVNTKHESLPAGSTTLFNETRRRYNLSKVAQEILSRLDKYYLTFKKEGLSFAVKEWKNLSSCLGSRIKVFYEGEEEEGVAIGIDQMTGALLLRTDNGFIKPVRSIETLTIEKEE
jgi:BirA family transcriptional regulator, biotin operon repressor / biotin---[acetyl-CoA-carboxylase] ligase